MGHQFGAVHIGGQFGDVRYAVINKVGYAYLSKVVTKDRILKDKEFLPTRKNMMEFKAAAMAASNLRECLGSPAKTFGDNRLVSRLDGLMRKVLNRGNGPFGQRSFEGVPNKVLLKNIEFHRAQPFKGRCQVRPVFAANVDRNSVQMDIASLDWQRHLTAPQGATHYRMFLTAGLLPDLEYVPATQAYASVDETLVGLNAYTETAMIALDSLVPVAVISLTAAFVGSPVVPLNVALVVGVGIEFLKEVNGYADLLSSGNVMKIAEVF